ncbi:hypothetical protein [Bacillus benzoevorans]|uniref:Uncharacterized protein n=1 Tax=Bacillus benzoevorans TaxID=1456 RepID=A0A7X0LTN4_9BACI|nr:hypothetical protein [Bacillus benzoevorans]MBB6443590.1 hypothetical protein [Bacillus benzoevorans]
MYKIHFVDAFSQEILKEENREDLHAVTELFRSSQNPNVIDCIITDGKNRTRRGKFVTCTINEENNDKIYKLHFKMMPEKIQA